jgi:hypothetical protein
MAEQLTLTDPVVVPEQVTSTYRVVALMLNSETVTAADPTGAPSPGLVVIQLRDNLGVGSSYQYVGAEAMDLIRYLNTGNFSIKSMQKRILEKLSKDGKLVGTVAGTPEAPTSPPPSD